MNSSSSTKQNLINDLEAIYGENFKSPLARDLDVNVATIRRIFNQRDDVPLVYLKAIQKIIEEKRDNAAR